MFPKKLYAPIVKDEVDYAYHIYDLLDILYEYRESIWRRIHNSIKKAKLRDTKVIYYDVTNYFFAIENIDPDEEDDEGNVISKGLRKVGVSKENSKNPIVQMPLFMDANGIPIAMDMFPGNTLDHLTAVPSFKSCLDKLNLEGPFIYIADRGIATGQIMQALVEAGNGYIIAKSIKKSTSVFKDWALDPNGYTRPNDNFKYKSKIVETMVKGSDGKMYKLKQQEIVYWSKKFYDREYAQHKSFLEFLDKLQSTPANFRITASQYYGLKRFLSKKVENKANGEILDYRKLIGFIDRKKVEEFTSLMGYYRLVTSELDMDPREAIDKYHGLNQIENQFAELKGTLDTRPMYVSTPEHIHAHML